jgi:Holliday junction resolvasome RuvABC endonuclease subunit
MVVMGFDIASYKTGYFILDLENIRYKIGLIESKSKDQHERIRHLHSFSKKLFSAYEPAILIIEDCYLDEWRKHTNGTKKRGNVSTFKLLARCHGAVISATDDLIDIFYMQPTEHKELLTGMGNASKQSTIWQIQRKLNLVGIDDNMADAAALVIAYLVKRQQWDILEKIKQKYEVQ